MAFVWVFSAGVMIVGLIAMFINGEAIFVPTGLLGGTLWATGNLCVVPIIKTIGLGLGILLWGGTSLVTGFLVGKMGMFGLHKDTVSIEWMNWMGISFIVVSMIIFFFIKPQLEEDRAEYKSLNTGDDDEARRGDAFIEHRLPKRFRLAVGFFLSVVSGMLYGVNMVPMKIWVQGQATTPKPLAFVFSHFTGIYIFTTVVFLIYCIVKRPPQIFPESIFPSFVSGAMWGIAQCGLMVATEMLGFTVGFPIGSAGPSIVSAFWSVFIFREIRGVRNLGLLVGSFAFLGAGIVLLSKSH